KRLIQSGSRSDAQFYRRGEKSDRLLAYREIQSDAAGRSERLSTVVLHRDDEGRLYWRHLQETFCG
ncbi:hypothetical protein LES17_27430, partial [Pseudomonas aeruginosa]